MYVPRHLEGVYVPGHSSASPCARMNIKNEYQTGSHLDPAALHGTCCHDRPGPDTQVGADELRKESPAHGRFPLLHVRDSAVLGERGHVLVRVMGADDRAVRRCIR